MAMLLKQKSDIQDKIKNLTAEELRPQLEKQLERWNETFYTNEDILIFIGRHYNWKYDRMQDWFNRSDDLEI
jgi:hypothetical protein